MTKTLDARLAALEKRNAPPGKVIVLWPGDPEPQGLAPTDHVIRVVFGAVADVPDRDM